MSRSDLLYLQRRAHHPTAPRAVAQCATRSLATAPRAPNSEVDSGFDTEFDSREILRKTDTAVFSEGPFTFHETKDK
jgi:hypothetical protein